MSLAEKTREIEEIGSSKHIAFGILMPSLAAFGLLGNSMLIIIFNQKRMKSPPSVYMTFLSLADIVYTILMLMLLSSEYSQVSSRSPLSPTFYAHAFPITQSLQVVMSALIITLTVDGYMFGLHAEKSVRYSTVKKAVKLAFAVSGVVVVFHFVNYFQFRVVVMDFKDGSSREVICTTDLHNQQSYQYYDKYAYVIIFVLIPWLLILAVNSALFIQVKIMSIRSLISVNSEEFKDGRSVKLQAIVSILRLITEIPFLCYRIAVWTENIPIKFHINCFFEDNILNYSNYFQNLEICYIMFQCINSNIKFYLFLIFSTRFRYFTFGFLAESFDFDFELAKTYMERFLPEQKVEPHEMNPPIFATKTSKEINQSTKSRGVVNSVCTIEDENRQITSNEAKTDDTNNKIEEKVEVLIDSDSDTEEIIIPSPEPIKKQISLKIEQEKKHSKLASLLKEDFKPSIEFTSSGGRTVMVKKSDSEKRVLITSAEVHRPKKNPRKKGVV
ncbi:unnamed protein product [Dimorphilus gyrociliatus]|uniref:G-protein coupled receptors family 1 profile domain-containing protein n=1 Tax=Dimorphilus gyrociliatus TaxID=2664684 RepID=A0A7I8W396_9ANNE|nr:unnamed protein product [Dimorphilus gyrociliatus]